MVDDDEQEQRKRIAAKAGLQLGAVGGAITLALLGPAAAGVAGGVAAAGSVAAELLDHYWRDPAIRRIRDLCEKLENEFQRLRIDSKIAKRRLDESERAQALFRDCLVACARSTSEQHRQRLAALLARGVTSDDSEIAEVAFLLRAWEELDDVEKLIFLARAARVEPAEMFPAVFDPKVYFAARAHDDRMLKDDMHVSRIQHMMSIRLLRPIDSKRFEQGNLSWEFKNFWITKIGEKLAGLLDIGDQGRGDSSRSQVHPSSPP